MYKIVIKALMVLGKLAGSVTSRCISFNRSSVGMSPVSGAALGNGEEVEKALDRRAGPERVCITVGWITHSVRQGRQHPTVNTARVWAYRSPSTSHLSCFMGLLEIGISFDLKNKVTLGIGAVSNVSSGLKCLLVSLASQTLIKYT